MKADNLDISLGESSATLAVLSSLQADPISARSVRHVTVKGGKRGNNIPPSTQQITALFAEIGRSCPGLEYLRVALDSTSIAVPVAALTSFFQQGPKHLKSLKLSGVISIEHQDEADALEAVIREKGPPCWNEIRLEFCEPSPNVPSLDPLLQALSSSGTLERVTLSGTSITHSNVCTGPSLARLVRENDLKVLTIWGGKRKLVKDDTLSLIQALQGNTSLKELTLHAPGLCPAIGQALAHTLETNTTMERLILSVSDKCPSSSKPSSYVNTTTRLAQALRLHNRTLKLLSLDYSMEEQDSLATGDSLDYDFYEYELIDIRASQWRSNVQQVRKAFTQMLQCNPVLDVLWMNLGNQEEEDVDDDQDEAFSHGVLTSEMDMLLRLNRYGIRQRLFEAQPAASNHEWVKALASQKDDLNALYFLLSRNPSFCCPSSRKREAPEGMLPARKRQKTCH